MSTWFSTAAVLAQLRDEWELSTGEASWLTIVVQLGFVAGAVSSSVSNLADRIAPLQLMFLGATAAAVANAFIVVSTGFWPTMTLRFLTGAALALVYPPALKAMSAWYRTGRGLALGVMIGALTAGSAMPHLLNGLGGLDWRPTMLFASGLTAVGGVIAYRFGVPGPHGLAPAVFDLRASASQGGSRAEAEWKLFSGSGALVGIFPESEASGGWATLSDDALRAMARRVASRLRRNADLRRATLTSVASAPPITSIDYSAVLPGGAPASAHLHQARTVARRAERKLVTMMGEDDVNPLAMKYINRVSDFLFVAARWCNDHGKADVKWVPGGSR